MERTRDHQSAALGAYVTVDNIDQTLASCTSLGGKVVVSPMELPNVGRMAVIQELQGAVLHVMVYAAAC